MKKQEWQETLEKSEFLVQFDFKTFLKFFIYHFLFFFMGPFSCAIIVLFENFALINNMAFWVRAKNKKSLVTQYL